uniref:MULE transposase domain-containing protein n=1 Tax=Lactuca sativa TaxID=4236 RepID=A0A9R1VL90_LACSA|nr:hypothetical protein LSAT_V11C500246930 [Lactuca sativa]
MPIWHEFWDIEQWNISNLGKTNRPSLSLHSHYSFFEQPRSDQMAKDDALVVEVQYNKHFFPSPFTYFDPDKKEIRDKGYSEFIAHLELITRRMCKDVYYCPDGQTLCQGLATLQNDCDYHEFLEYLHDKKKIEMEEHEVEDDTNSNKDEVDVIDKEGWEQEMDDEERGSIQIMQKKDMFLNKICPNDEVEEDPNVKQLPLVYPVHNSEQQWDRMAPVELKHCLTNYAVKHGYDLWYEKNDKNSLLVKCCKGYGLLGCKRKGIFRLSHLNQLITVWIGKQFFNVLLENPKLSLRKLKAQISNTYNIIVSIGQCRNAKRFALSEIEGTLKEHYSRLWDYGIEIKRANPGSTVSMEVDHMADGSTMFKWFYRCKRWLVEGCRRVIGIDGCFLKGICKGKILAAVGRDSNNHMFPIAWAVVTVESKETWKWFLDLLMDDIERGNGNGLTLLSDGHKAEFIESIKEKVPHAEHRLCARHILANFNTRFKGEHFIKPFWRAKHEAAMQEIKELDNRAFNYLIERDPKCYCRAFQVEGVLCDAIENGISESFNAEIVEARHKPIITMLEDIRRTKGESWDLTICPSIRKEITDLKDKQRFWAVYPCGYQQFEVVLLMGFSHKNFPMCACKTLMLGSRLSN